MKVVKFRDYLVPLILNGTKNSTCRLFDDKNLSVGDEIELKEFNKNDSFAKAKILRVVEKQLSQLTDDDKAGHEQHSSSEEMYETFSGYYNTSVGPETIVKIIWFDNLVAL